MFFIGVFGIKQNVDTVGARQNIVCPICGRYGSYDIIKICDYIHFFFIPLIKIKTKYAVKTHCCEKICGIGYDIGSRIENGEDIELSRDNIYCSESYVCPHCFSHTERDFSYCPHCGGKL
ncbi:MAG: zinc ribbon domain-containing protein [Clostridia bacterium]|nr:zinc ribbon domain-containing protein [Clostridia bacterium]